MRSFLLIVLKVPNELILTSPPCIKPEMISLKVSEIKFFSKVFERPKFIYNLLQSDIANALLKNKIANIEKIKPQIISTGNIGCITQIAHGTKIPILHTVEIIDWYTGGHKPKILDNS